MKRISILNHVLGPVMRGPSSSHTAGAYRIARAARAFLGGEPGEGRVRFDPGGSFGVLFREQGADKAFAAGLAGIPLADERFFQAVGLAEAAGIRLAFEVAHLEASGHPNDMELALSGREGNTLSARARSVGGGQVRFTQLWGFPVDLDFETFALAAEVAAGAEAPFREALDGAVEPLAPVEAVRSGERVLLLAKCAEAPAPEVLSRLEGIPCVTRVRCAPPCGLVPRGEARFDSAAGAEILARAHGNSLGRAAMEHEAALLGLPPAAVEEEAEQRLAVMAASVRAGLADRGAALQLLRPCAAEVARAEREGRLAHGGFHARLAARALAVMHVNSSMGVVCAAPTGGSAGVLPAVLQTLREEKGLPPEAIRRAFFAAGAVGLVTAARATFAAEEAGCQVEIGAAGAMAAAAVVEAAGGAAARALDAAAVAFQNTMGSVCDLVQGVVEIPCHTRNAAAASAAFVCADLVLGGYANPVPLDETVDAVRETGRMLPPALRCTARGGLAAAPSARALPRRVPGGPRNDPPEAGGKRKP